MFLEGGSAPSCCGRLWGSFLSAWLLSLAFTVGLRACNLGRGCPAPSPPPGEAGRASAGSSQYPLGHALLLRGGKGARRLCGQSR